MEVQENPVQLKNAAGGERVRRSGFWENRLEPFLQKYCLALCLFLVVVACARIISTYSALSITVDEPTHLNCGLEYVAKHIYNLEPQHPPLSRAMEALGPYLVGARPAEDGATAIANSGRVNLVIFLMRLGNLPFFLLGCLVVGLWGNMFGRPVAVLGVALFTLLPTMLADGGLATTDMALGATVGAAFLAFIFWAKKPTVGRSLLLGLCAALTFLSKFSALGYLPATGVLAVVCYVAVRWPAWRGGNLRAAGPLTLAWDLIVRWSGWRDLSRLAKARLAPFAIAVSTMCLLIWACYWFSFGTVSIHNHMIKLPAPQFFNGVRDAMRHSRGGHGAFLLGNFSWAGWWYYFPLVLLLKTPIAFLILLAVGTLVCLRNRFRPIYLIPLAFSLGILWPAMQSHVDIGVRHVDPVFIAFSIIAALGLRQLLQWTRTGPAVTLAGGLLAIWLVVSGGLVHPDYLSYLNAFAGKKPENILVDSNYDWGQNLKFLAKRLRQLGVQEFSMSVMDGVPDEDPNYDEAWYGLPAYKPVNPCASTPGWNVLSPTMEKSLSQWTETQYYAGPNMKPWYEQVAPTERLGPLLLYYVPSDVKLSCFPSTATNPAPITVDFSGTSQAQAKPDLRDVDIKTTKLSDNFYTLQSPGETIGVLTGSDGLGVFVAGGSSSTTLSPKVLEAIQKISTTPIQFVVNTRVHAEDQAAFQMNGEEVELIPVAGGQCVYFRNSDILMTNDFYGSMQYPSLDPANGSADDMFKGFETLLYFAGPATKIVPSRGPLINRAQVIAHKEMMLRIRSRVEQLVAQHKTRDQVLAAYPTSDYDAKVPNAKESTQKFVSQLYSDAQVYRSNF